MIDDRVQVLSQDYDPLFNTETPVCAGYFYDPKNFVDRYQVFWGTGSLCHDFHVGGVLTTEPHEVRAASMLANSGGQIYLLIAGGALNSKMGVFSIEGQPDASYLVPRIDHTYSNGTTQTPTVANLPEGVYLRNWDNFIHPLNTAELPEVLITGDGDLSTELSGYPMRLEWFYDFNPVSVGGGTTLNPTKEAQSATDRLYVFKLGTPHKRWFKFNLRMRSHYTDAAGGGASTSYFVDPSSEGDNTINFYGSIVSMLYTVGPREVTR